MVERTKALNLCNVVMLGVSVWASFASFAYAQGGVRGRMVERDVRMTTAPPEWLAIPAEGRLATSDGVDLAPLQNASVSYENAALGMLVGAFRNTGTCLRDAAVRLQYTDEQGAPIGEPIENEARVSLVEPDGLLPYRFRLKRKSDLSRAPVGYVVQVAEAGRPVVSGVRWVEEGRAPVRQACPTRPYAFEVSTGKAKATWQSYRLPGTLRVAAGGPIRPEGITITALLLDKDQQVLEVLTGAPDVTGASLPTGLLETGASLPFTLATPVPLGKWVADVKVFAEVLPDAQVAPDK